MPVFRITESPRWRLWSRFLRRLLSGAVVEKRHVCCLGRDWYNVAADVGASGRCETVRLLRWRVCSARRMQGRAALGPDMVKIASRRSFPGSAPWRIT